MAYLFKDSDEWWAIVKEKLLVIFVEKRKTNIVIGVCMVDRKSVV